jgi:hypothetical protein
MSTSPILSSALSISVEDVNETRLESSDGENKWSPISPLGVEAELGDEELGVGMGMEVDAGAVRPASEPLSPLVISFLLICCSWGES